jgi:NitT/TauT family transport system ATP-binding protein
MTFLRLEAISKTYATAEGTVRALDAVTLDVEQGAFVVLLGPSGCGKSTLLRIVAGLEPATSGRVTLAGQPVGAAGAQRSLIAQRPSLFPWLTACDNVAFGLRMAGMSVTERRRRAQEALERVGLGEAGARYPHELSGGMQQRVALMRALVLDPLVLLMDEPLAAVDALLRARLQRQLAADCAGRTVLLVTHSIREALVLADRMVILTPRPGRVQHMRAPEGRPPRAPDAALVRLEREIEEELGS